MSLVKVAWRLLHSLNGLAIFTLVKPNVIGFRKNIDSYSTRVQKYLLFSPHNLHFLTLESGTVDINLAILGIDFCVYYVYI
jgi:hypothetical protein